MLGPCLLNPPPGPSLDSVPLYFLPVCHLTSFETKTKHRRGVFLYSSYGFLIIFVLRIFILCISRCWCNCDKLVGPIFFLVVFFFFFPSKGRINVVKTLRQKAISASLEIKRYSLSSSPFALTTSFTSRVKFAA